MDKALQTMNIILKFIILIFSFFLLFGCTKKNNFQFNGAYPNWEYTSMYHEEDILYIKGNDPAHIDFRNRIFVTIDSSLNILLNNHVVSLKEFEEGFEYLYINPDRKKHLPESPEKAVVFLALNMVANFQDQASPSLAKKKKYLEVSQIQLKMVEIIQQHQEAYVKNNLGNQLSAITKEQQKDIEKKFPLNMAMYSIALKESRKKMDQGIISKIPPWAEKDGKLKERNIIKVVVDDKNKLYLRDKIFPLENLTSTIKKMIMNVEDDPDFPEGPRKAIVSLKNHRETDYKKYLKVYNALKNAYNELWEEQSQNLFGKPYESLNKKEQREIKKIIPFVLSEAEPVFNGE